MLYYYLLGSCMAAVGAHWFITRKAPASENYRRIESPHSGSMHDALIGIRLLYIGTSLDPQSRSLVVVARGCDLL